jgi:hypothetical protein
MMACARVVGLAMALLMGPAVAGAQDQTRVDLYDASGRREGYAIIDHEASRVDLYDRSSRRTGYGRIEPDGRVDLFDQRGARRGHLQPSPRLQDRKR